MTRTVRFPASITAAIAAFCMASAFALAQEPQPAKPVPVPNTLDDPNVPSSGAVVLGADEGPLVAPGEAPDLIFEFTGKVSGYVEPCG